MTALRPSLRAPGTGATTRRADIQGLRALSVVLVVLYHADMSFSGGFVGVDAFFVISGFVITAMMLRELERTGTLGFKDFYQRRARRLMPALAVTLLVVAVLVGLLASPLGPQDVAARTGITASLISANYTLFRSAGAYFDASSHTNPLLHMWSLSVEEQFYLVFPLLTLVSWRLGRRLRDTWTRAGVGVVMGVSFVVSFVLADVLTTGRLSVGVSQPRDLAFYASPTRAWEFLAGALLAVGERHVAAVARRAWAPMQVVGIVLLGWSALTYDVTTVFPGRGAIIPVVGTALLVASGCGVQKGLSTLFSVRPAVFVGDLSYSWYLWHWPFIVFTRLLWPDAGWAVPIAAALSFAPAVLSLRRVEEPIRANTAIVGKKAIALAAVCVLVPVAAFTVVKQGAAHNWGSSTIEQTAFDTRLHLDETLGCATAVPLGERPAGDCRFEVANAKGDVLLIGDSQAGQYTEPVRDAANNLGYDMVVATRPACPFIPLETSSNVRNMSECQPFVAGTIQAALDRKPKLVVMATALEGYIRSDNVRLRDDDGNVATTPEAKAAMWTSSLSSLLGRFEQAGIPVVVMRPIPQFEGWDLKECPVFRLVNDPAGCGRTQSRSTVDADLALPMQAISDALRGHTKAQALGFFDQLCPDGTCRTNDWRTYWYRDSDHLGPTGATRLTGQFESSFRTALR